MMHTIAATPASRHYNSADEYTEVA